MSIKIVTDSNCDLPQEAIDEYGITVVPMIVNIGAESYLDGMEMSRQAFYEGLPGFRSHPTTSVPSPGEFYEAFERLTQQGADEILSIHIATSLSAVANSARLAGEELDSVLVTIFDSGNLTLGTGLQVLAAAKAAADEQSMDEIVTMLEDLSKRTYCFAALDTLEFLRRSGRLTRFQASLGSVLQFKPILTMNAGEFEMERVRTRSRALGRVVELVEALGPLEELTLVHTHAPDAAENLWRGAQHLFPLPTQPMSAEVTPVIGAHIGPGAVGFVAVAAHRQ